MKKENRVLISSLLVFASAAVYDVRSERVEEVLANASCKTWGSGDWCGHIYWCGGTWSDDGWCLDPNVADGFLIALDNDGCTAGGRMCP